MSLDILGPASANNSVTSRPSQTTTYGAVDTWFLPCTGGSTTNGTQLTNDWLNNILAQLRTVISSSGIVGDNGDDMVWRAIEVMSLRLCTDTGTQNALVVTNTPPVPAYRAGLTLAVVPANANNGAASIDSDGLGNELIVNEYGNPLVGGEMDAGRLALLIYDGLNFRLINPIYLKLRTGFNKLAGTAPGGGQTATWTVEQLTALSSENVPATGHSLSLSFNGGSTGVGGMDTGDMPTAGDLSIYAINNPATGAWGTLGCDGSTSNGSTYTGTNAPAGYTRSCLIWCGVTTGGNLPFFAQRDRDVIIYENHVLTGGAATAYTSVNLSAAVPAAAISAGGYLYANCAEFEHIVGGVQHRRLRRAGRRHQLFGLGSVGRFLIAAAAHTADALL